MTKKSILRALVVDDNPDERTLISRALQRVDFNCETANDGIMAENMLRNRQYDVVVTDLRMPRKHGHQLIVELLDRPNPPLVIAVTGLAEPKLVIDLLDRGVAEVVQKPLNYNVLAAKISALLRRRYDQEPDSARDSASQVAESIGSTADSLRQQLSQVTDTFQATIAQLESQKKKLQEEFIDSLRVLGNLVTQAGDPLQSHVGRVEILSESIGRHLGLTPEQLHALKFAALMHDVGQLRMPDRLRNKAPWALSPEELTLYAQYPLVGAALLSGVRGAEMASVIIEAHCENYDGTGFPNKLRGADIPLEARILRVADGCDLVRMHTNPEDVLDTLQQHLHSEKGHAYDPELVGAAIACLSKAYVVADDNSKDVRPVGSLTPGMVLAENVYDEHGHFLARQGAQLSEGMIRRLQRLLRGSTVAVTRES